MALRAALAAALTAVFATSAPATFAATGAPVLAWGADESGEIGNGGGGAGQLVSSPVRVVGPGGSGTLAGVTSVAAGSNYSVALASDGTVWAWGDDTYGQLGNGTTGPGSATPVQVVGPSGIGTLTGVSAIAAGRFFNLALRSDGTVWAWGRDDFGQLGNGTSGASVTSPVPVEVLGPGGGGTLGSVVAIAAGALHGVALRSDGSVWGWGDDFFGQLGDNKSGSGVLSTSPVQALGPSGVGTLSGVSALAASFGRTLALKSDGSVWAWGDDDCGQLGDGANGTCGSDNASVATPEQVLGAGGIGTLAGVTAIAAGNKHGLALRSDGTVWAWGDQTCGQLGNGASGTCSTPGSGGFSSTPVQVRGPGGSGNLTGISAISAGRWHSAALTPDGKIWTWGDGTFGQLGNGASGNGTIVATPIQIAHDNFDTASALGAGPTADHAVAVELVRALSVTLTGTGGGSVSGSGIACPSGCSATYPLGLDHVGSAVSLTATPAAGSHFDGWSGACSGAGSCSLTMDANRAVTATFTADAAAAATQQQDQPPAPVFARSINVTPVSGTVLVRVAGARVFAPLHKPSQVAVGSIIDARHGRVRLTIADRSGRLWTADFYEGVFKVTQLAKDKGVAVLALIDGSARVCGKRATRGATAAKKPKSLGHLWGQGSGPFRTSGRYAAAAIRGTTWDTDDRCDGTLVKVTAGAVTVRDFVRRRSVVVRAHHQYLAKAR